VQTFVLAKQPTGYFVLNDIFRYISEEGEEEPENLGQAEDPLLNDVEMPKAQGGAEEALDAESVDKKLETVQSEEPAAAEEAPATNGNTEASAEAEKASVADSKAEEEVPSTEDAEKAVEEEIKEPEKPAEPSPSPLPTSAKVVAPAQPAAPPKPLTWASRAAAAAGPPKPAVPVIAPKSAATPPAQARTAPPATSSKPAQSQPSATSTAPSEKNKENDPPTPGGWQSVGNEHAKRQNRPQSISGPPEKEGTMGYVRNVTEKVLDPALREVLSSFGKLIYFDINRTKVGRLILFDHIH